MKTKRSAAFTFCALGAVLVFALGTALPAAAQGNSIEAIDVSPQQAGRIVVKVTLKAPPATPPAGFTIVNPPRALSRMSSIARKPSPNAPRLLGLCRATGGTGRWGDGGACLPVPPSQINRTPRRSRIVFASDAHYAPEVHSPLRGRRCLPEKPATHVHPGWPRPLRSA